MQERHGPGHHPLRRRDGKRQPCTSANPSRASGPTRISMQLAKIVAVVGITHDDVFSSGPPRCRPSGHCRSPFGSQGMTTRAPGPGAAIDLRTIGTAVVGHASPGDTGARPNTRCAFSMHVETKRIGLVQDKVTTRTSTATGCDLAAFAEKAISVLHKVLRRNSDGRSIPAVSRNT